MAFFKQVSRLAAAAGLVILGLGAAQAGSVGATCPNTGAWDRYFSLSSDSAAVSSVGCYGWGNADDGVSPDVQADLDADGYTLSGVVSSTETVAGFESMAALLGGFGGGFNISKVIDAVIVFKATAALCTSPTPVDALRCMPSFAAFDVRTTGAALFNWATTLNKGALRFALIYERPVPVPLPAAGLLLLGALGGLTALRRRKTV